MEEQASGEQVGAGIAESGVEEIGVGRIEDEGGERGVLDGELSCEGGSDAGAVGDDVLGRDGAGGGEVLPGGIGVAGHILLAGVGGGALAVASVVEGEDVDAEVVEAGEGGDGILQGAVGAGEEEESRLGVAAVGR